MKYQPTIGIETHVQLKTKSKLFCSCDNDARGKEPNTTVCPVCMGFPGTLPVLNKRAVELAIRAGLALNATIVEFTKFDRKNYFYPDLPKGYQISQYDQPIVVGGHVEVPMGGEMTTVRLTRAHLEEDAGKLTHPSGADYSLLDLNRAGTPLLEIVSEPDIYSAAQARAYVQELNAIVRYADVSDADMYHGHMRFDVNVSLSATGELGTRAEVKNLNSFRSVERAAIYEIERQTEILDSGKKVVQETRGWDEDKGETYSLRSKEEAHDYRYFPEPDLPPLIIKSDMIAEIQKALPKLPHEVRARLQSDGIDAKTAEAVAADPVKAKLYVEAKGKDTKKIANLLTAADNTLELGQLIEVHDLLVGNKLSFTAAKQVMAELKPGDSAETVAEKLNVIQVSDSGALEKIVEGVLSANQGSVDDYKSGKQQALGFLVGQVMKVSKGQANPAMVNEILKKKLS